MINTRKKTCAAAEICFPLTIADELDQPAEKKKKTNDIIYFIYSRFRVYLDLASVLMMWSSQNAIELNHRRPYSMYVNI